MKHSAVPIKNITRDASGAIIGWSERGFDFTVSHNADGLPIIVNGTDGINSVWAKLNYVDGKFVGVVGDSIDSAVMNEIFAVAIGRVVTTSRDPVTGGIGIIGPDGMQVAGNAAPYSFTSRQLADTDNGMNLVCATAQTATVNADLPVGFGCSFEGAISFTAGDGVTIADLRTTGATDIFCGLMQTGANAYKVRGGKA